MTCRERILSEEYADIITDYILPPSLLSFSTIDYCWQRISGDFGIIYLNIDEARDVTILPFSYQSIPIVFGLMVETKTTEQFDQLTLINSGITSVQNEPLNLKGEGITIAIIDTGIDYTSPVFQKQDGTSRITAIWDQTIQTGESPNGFLYGSEYTREEINKALKEQDPYRIVPSRDENGHGSNVASVAAGSKIDGGKEFCGAAPECNIVVVKLREAKNYLKQFYKIPEGVPCYSETDILMALKYVMGFWEPFTKPIVICFSLGSSMGDHAGNSILSRYLNDHATRRSVGLVVAGGNEGNASKHYQNILPAENGMSSDTVEFRVSEGENGFVMELWGNTPALFTVSMRSPGGEKIPKVTFRTTKTVEYRFVYEKTILTVDYILVEQGSGEQLIFFRFENPTPGIWTMYVTNETENIQAPFLYGFQYPSL